MFSTARATTPSPADRPGMGPNTPKHRTGLPVVADGGVSDGALGWRASGAVAVAAPDAREAGAGLGDAHPLVQQLAPDRAGGRLFATFLAGFPASTASVYRQRLAAFATFLGVAPDALASALVARGPAATTLAVREFAAHLRGRLVPASRGGAARLLAPATRNGYVNAVRSFLRFLQRTHLVDWHVHVPPEPVTPYRDTAGPGVAAVGQVLRAAGAAADPRVAARDAALVSLYADWALRASEPLGLNLGDVECDAAGHPAAVWVQGKGRTDRERFTLPPATGDALAAWLVVRSALADHDAEGAGCAASRAAARRDPRPLFVALDPAVGRRRATLGDAGPVTRLSRRAVNYIVARLGRRVGLARLTPHMLRHTAITAVLDAGASIREAQRFSRHRDPRVLLRYDDNREDLGGRRAAELSARYRGVPTTP